MDAYETWMKGYYIKHGFFSSEAEMHAAFKAGREAGMREAARIAGNWANVHCHIETADEYRIIADFLGAILAAAGDK